MIVRKKLLGDFNNAELERQCPWLALLWRVADNAATNQDERSDSSFRQDDIDTRREAADSDGKDEDESEDSAVGFAGNGNGNASGNDSYSASKSEKNETPRASPATSRDPLDGEWSSQRAEASPASSDGGKRWSEYSNPIMSEERFCNDCEKTKRKCVCGP